MLTEANKKIVEEIDLEKIPLQGSKEVFIGYLKKSCNLAIFPDGAIDLIETDDPKEFEVGYVGTWEYNCDNKATDRSIKYEVAELCEADGIAWLEKK